MVGLFGVVGGLVLFCSLYAGCIIVWVVVLTVLECWCGGLAGVCFSLHIFGDAV